MADGARSAKLDLAMAEEISVALTAIANDLPYSLGRLSLRRALEGGLLTVRRVGDHMVCHDDPATADTAAWDRALRQHLGDNKADLVQYQPTSTPPTDLVALLEQVVRRDWHPRAAAHGLAVWIDWEREILVITSGAPATDEVAQTLIELVGTRGVVTTGATFGRGRSGR